MTPTAPTRPTQHTIDNDEIGLTYCGRLLPYRAATDPTPWPLPDGDVALWDDDTYLEGFDPCPACWAVYGR
jgi:hypothetical protein